MKLTAKEYGKAWRESNRERVAAYAKKYRAENRERIREQDRKRPPRPRDKAKKSATAKRHYHRHAEQVREAAMLYYLQNKEKRKAQISAWFKGNKWRSREYFHRRRCAAGGTPRISAAGMALLFEINAGLCCYCLKNPADSIDHVQPLSRGGSHSLENMVAACQSCNSSKHARTLLETMLNRRLLVTRRMVGPA